MVTCELGEIAELWDKSCSKITKLNVIFKSHAFWRGNIHLWNFVEFTNLYLVISRTRHIQLDLHISHAIVLEIKSDAFTEPEPTIVIYEMPTVVQLKLRLSEVIMISLLLALLDSKLQVLLAALRSRQSADSAANLWQLLTAFHCESPHSFMGISITRNTVLCLNKMLSLTQVFQRKRITYVQH